jgi:hypothetical protein
LSISSLAEKRAWRDLTNSKYRPICFNDIYYFVRGTQAEFLDKGKPVVSPGRKAMGLDSEIARPPKGNIRSTKSVVVKRTSFAPSRHATRIA